MKHGNRFTVRKVDKRVHNASIAELVKQKRHAALAVVVTVPPGTAGAVKIAQTGTVDK
jgi:hypothetical protein